MAHVIAAELDVDPMQALLLCVRRAAAWSAFYHRKLAEAESDEELAPGHADSPAGGRYHWVEAAERTTSLLAKYSQLAINAGVAAMLVQRATVEGEQIARVLNAALAEVDLPADVESRMRNALRNAMLALEAEGGQLAIAAGTADEATP